MAAETYIGDGIVYLTDGQNPSVEVRGMQAFSFSSDENEESIQNYDDGAGGKLDSFRELTAVTISLEFASHASEILKEMTRGSVADSGTTEITGEIHAAYAGQFIPLKYTPDTAQTLSVSSDSSPLTLDTDYAISTNKNGLIILQDTNIVADQISVTYTPMESKELIAFQRSAPVLRLQIDGWNKAKSRPYLFEAERVRLGNPQDVALITSSYNTITVEGECLKAQAAEFSNGFFRWVK